MQISGRLSTYLCISQQKDVINCVAHCGQILPLTFFTSVWNMSLTVKSHECMYSASNQIVNQLKVGIHLVTLRCQAKRSHSTITQAPHSVVILFFISWRHYRARSSFHPHRTALSGFSQAKQRVYFTCRSFVIVAEGNTFIALRLGLAIYSHHNQKCSKFSTH